LRDSKLGIARGGTDHQRRRDLPQPSVVAGMTDVTVLDNEPFQTTDGDIAIVNLNSARLRSWSRFDQDPLRAGVAETVLEHEQLTAQFASDLSALGRMEAFGEQLGRLDASSPSTLVIQAQIASTLHRFSDARHYLAQASLGGASHEDIKRILLSVDQACGTNLEDVLDERRRIVAKSSQFEDRVALGALLADLGEFDVADETYRQALRGYQDVSPFPVAWVCFQLGMLWGELVPATQLARAEHWYRKAVVSLPSYVRARVHLAEICSATGRTGEAVTILRGALTSGDPEVSWRLADVLNAEGRFDEAALHLEGARSGFERVLEKHLLAFADHGAEFYIGSGNDPLRALELAQINLQSRPTLRAFQQTYAIALEAGESEAATQLCARATKRWGNSQAFQYSQFAKTPLQTGKGAVA
jgi:tetratricopeptide (TPR) repeat protein